MVARRPEVKTIGVEIETLPVSGPDDSRYASEILHLARIHPERPADRLSAKEILRMALAAERVLRDAITHEGSTLSDGTYRDALNQAGSYQQLDRVYDRSGELCPTCRKGTIFRIVQAQRSSFFCPGCQSPSGE
jgi:formamidopyrimidine-DNA glycosylase